MIVKKGLLVIYDTALKLIPVRWYWNDKFLGEQLRLW